MQPATGVVAVGGSSQITVQPVLTGLVPGVYTGEIVLNFGEGNTNRHIATLLIVTAGDAASLRLAHAQAGGLRRQAVSACVPTKLLPVFTQLGADFATVAAWPTPIEVTVVDDCGNFLTTGSVTASFSDGDPSLPLPLARRRALERYVATGGSAPQVVITADALEALPPRLRERRSIGGALQANPTTPSDQRGRCGERGQIREQSTARAGWIDVDLRSESQLGTESSLPHCR